jgi:hypothetical protein
MFRILALLCVAILVWQPVSASAPLRQIRSCMLQRMTADRYLSYNDAKKVCLDLLKEQNGLLASSSASKRALPPMSSREASSAAK